MRTNFYCFLSFIIVILISGCASTVNMPQGDVLPGFIYGATTYPSMKDSSTRYEFSGDDIEVLGTVESVGVGHNILFLFSVGNNGYQRLLAEAKRKYPETDALINIYWDTDFFYIGWPWPYLPLYHRAQSIVTATAIKLK